MTTPDATELKIAALQAALSVLEPLARLLIDCGIGVGETHSVLKRAFVSAAHQASGAGHRPNISRLATLTGLRRADIAEILQDRAPEAASHRGRSRAERVLQGWWTDREFMDPAGLPAILPLRGAKKSFTALVNRYSGDPQVPALLDELRRVRAVHQYADERVEALSRTTATVHWSPEGLETLGQQVRDQLQTLIHNLKHPSRPLYQRQIVNQQLDPKYAAMLVRDFTNQIDAAANLMNDSLNDPRVTKRAAAKTGPTMRLGMGVYLFENMDSQERPNPARRPHTPNRIARRNKTKGTVNSR